MDIKQQSKFLPISIIISAAILAAAWIYTEGLKIIKTSQETNDAAENKQIIKNNSLKNVEENNGEDCGV